MALISELRMNFVGEMKVVLTALVAKQLLINGKKVGIFVGEDAIPFSIFQNNL